MLLNELLFYLLCFFCGILSDRMICSSLSLSLAATMQQEGSSLDAMRSRSRSTSSTTACTTSSSTSTSKIKTNRIFPALVCIFLVLIARAIAARRVGEHGRALRKAVRDHEPPQRRVPLGAEEERLAAAQVRVFFAVAVHVETAPDAAPLVAQQQDHLDKDTHTHM